MTDLEAATSLRAALAQVQSVKQGLDRYEMPGRDCWWVLCRVEADLADAIARFAPDMENAYDDVTRSIVAMASGGHIR